MSETLTREYRTEHYIKKCGGKCDRYTRPPWMAKHLAPDTIQRATATECHSCYRDRQREEGTLPPRRPRGRKPSNSGKVRGTGGSAEQAHALFLAGRNQRLAKSQRKRVA
ncbi:hypothetical protein SEA_PUREGLOBE5_77 [Arthrobacter phage Pureglobe5]|nr:hypothetical protein SEA_PUREGLOBE5_77 [Arthrobacter phage Pureglobe5]